MSNFGDKCIRNDQNAILGSKRKYRKIYDKKYKYKNVLKMSPDPVRTLYKDIKYKKHEPKALGTNRG